MKKLFFTMFVLLTLAAPFVHAAATTSTLSDSVDTYENSLLNTSGELILKNAPLNLIKVPVAPDYQSANNKLLFLTSASGTFINTTYGPNFKQLTTLPDALKNQPIDIIFDGQYYRTGTLLAYNKKSVYLSFDMGQTWREALTSEEDLLKVDFGPEFHSYQQIYFITATGLYRKDLNSNTITKVVANDDSGAVRDFNYLRVTNKSGQFFVAKGNKILKTVDTGTTWTEYAFDKPIVGFAVLPDGTYIGDVLVITADQVIHYAQTGLAFYNISLPEGVAKLYGLKYMPQTNADVLVIFTDKGFYITYDTGATWKQLFYMMDFLNNPLKDYYVVENGSNIMLYAVLGDKLYRDVAVPGTFEEYMNGIPDPGYMNEGNAISKNILTLNNEELALNQAVGSATLTATEELNGQIIKYSMTADGINWEEVTPGVEHTFAKPGIDLHWKAVLSTTDTKVTPALKGVSVNYNTVEITQCAGFTDVPISDPNCEALTYVKSAGIFTGNPDGTFLPDKAINRAEVVKVVTEGFSCEMLPDDGTNLGFSDVVVGEWYMGYLKIAKEAGIIEGYKDGTFKPEQTVNFVEMLKIFFLGAGETIPEPLAGQAWFQPYVDYATTNQFTIYEVLSAGMKRVDVANMFYKWHLLEKI